MIYRPASGEAPDRGYRNGSGAARRQIEASCRGPLKFSANGAIADTLFNKAIAPKQACVWVLVENLPHHLEVEMDWQTAANIGNALTPVIALGAVFYAAYQVNELKRQSRMSALLTAIDFIQEDQVRKARSIVYSLKDNRKRFDTWTREERDATDLSLRRYNRLAMMIEDGLISQEPLLSEFGNSIVDCWRTGQPLVEEYRKTRTVYYWRKLEKLCDLAVARGAK